MKMCLFFCAGLFMCFAGCADYSPMSEDQLPRKLALYDSTHESTVWLRWTPSDAIGFWHYRVYMAQSASADSTDSLLYEIDDRNDTAVVISGLDLEKTWSFQVYVHTIHDTAAGSNIIAIGNLTDVEPDSLGAAPDTITLKTDSVFSTGVHLRWSASKDSLFEHYLVIHQDYAQLDTFSISSIDTSLDYVQAISNQDCTSLVIDGLVTDTLHWFAVYVQNTNKRVTASNVVVNWPVLLQVDDKTDSSVMLSWSRSNSPDYKAYQLYRTDIESDTAKPRPIGAAIQDVLTITYVDSTVVSGKRYAYYIVVIMKGLEEFGSNVVRVQVP